MEVLQRTANRGSISTGFDIDNSVKLEPDNSEFFQRAATGSSGNLKTWTFSLWLKRTEISHACIFYSQGSYGRVRFETDDTLTFYFNSGHELSTTRKFRDTSAWYHIVLAVDTTDGTAANRLKVYVNGVQETMSGTQPSQNEEGDFGKFASVTAQLGQFVEGSYYFAGYMAEFYWIDGIQQAPTEFGEFDSDSGIWKPKAYVGSFGSEGAYLDFSDAANLGDDVSGNGNDYAEQNITAADQAVDTPTNNFATGNPLVPLKANTILTEGATNYKNVGSAGWSGFASSIAVQSGKWYVEFTAAGATTMCGVGNVNDFLNSIYYGNWNTSIGFYGTAGLLFIDGSTSGAGPNNTWSGTAYGNGSIVGIALDKDNGCVYMSVNGTFANSGDPTSGASKTGGVELTKGNADYSASDYFYIGASHNIDNGILQANYGGYTTDTPSSAATDENGMGAFEFAPPTGYYALCTKNLAEYG